MSARFPVASGFYNYSRLTKNTTPYANRMNRLKNEIFTEVVRKTNLASFNVVRRHAKNPIDLQPSIVDFYGYIRHPETDQLISVLRDYGLFRDEHRDFNEEMERLRELRGKGKKPYMERLHARLKQRAEKKAQEQSSQ